MFNKDSLNIKQFRGQGFMTVSKFSSDGELLFIADKDSKYITQISTTNNEIIGTYNGHNGVIWSLDITTDKKYMVSCSGDMTFIIWNVLTGEIINRINECGIPKYISINNDLIAIVCDPISKRLKSYISIYSLSDLLNNKSDVKYKLEEENNIRATTVKWLNEEILLLTYDDGTIKKVDYKLNKILNEAKIHDLSIKFVFIDNKKENILTSSLDHTAKLISINTFEIKKIFKSTVPINCAVLTPDDNYVLLGGGIEAMMVAKTSDNDLTTKIFDVSSEKLLKQISNHFGPLRYLDFNPNKSSFVTASQDGIAKIHYFSPIINIKSERSLFGLAIEKDDLTLNNEIIKIEEAIKSNENQKKIVNNEKKKEIIDKNYPIGHPLYKKPNKNTTEYKINSKIEVESKKNSCIKVSNLPSDIDIKDLWDIFEYCGRIEEYGIRIKQFANDTVAFVNYSNYESAQNAIEKIDRYKIGYSIIKVEMTYNK